MRDNVRQRGVDVLNAVLNVYIQDNIENKNQLATNSLKFIDGQLEGITKELKLLESDIKLFKVENSVSNISSEAEFYLKQAGELDKIVSEIDVKLSVINYLESYVNDNGNLINASPTSLGIQDPLLVTLISKLSQLTAERESLLEFTKVDNPLIASLDVKIQETRKSLAKNVQSIRSGLLASKKELKGQLSSVERKVSRLPKAEYELLGLQRQYAIQESLYLMLLEKKSESSIILASTVSDHKVVDAARAAARPISPKKKNLYILGLAAGIGIPGMYLLLIVLFDNRIKDVDELKRATNIPLLGIIPHHTESSYLVVNNNSNSAIGESFRSIRTNLSFMIDPKELADGVSPKVIQLTSAMGSEGKSFCSINLSASLALGGAKTIVVGLDLRKPKLAEYFGMSNAVGASSVLAGLNALDEAIVKTEVENLDVLVAGPIPPNPSELLMGKSLAAMLNQLTKDYDSVVLDTPPIGLVTDSLIISEHAATSIYVVRQNTTNTSSMLYVNDLYNSGKMKSVSLLFNDVKLTRFGYGYGYGYGYGNGYYAESGPKGIVDRIREAIFQ
jgi:capsular exopolysaccharide synthesis family protein